jgi:hypothetical protein
MRGSETKAAAIRYHSRRQGKGGVTFAHDLEYIIKMVSYQHPLYFTREIKG